MVKERRPSFVLPLLLLGLVLCPSGAAYAGKPDYAPAYSTWESKWRGVFISCVDVAPRVVHWKGKKIAIKEAWLEYKTERTDGVLFSKYKKINQQVLCIKFSGGMDVFWSDSDSPMLWTKGKEKERSFTMVGTMIMWDEVADPKFKRLTLVITDGSPRSEVKVLEVTRRAK